MSDLFDADGGRITKFDATGNQLKSAKAKPIQFAFRAETIKCTQTFAYRGPENSSHVSRALDIVGKMSSKRD